MKIVSIQSWNVERRGQGDRAAVSIRIDPENELEKAILRMSRSAAKREVFITSAGTLEISITMPRGSYEP